MKFFQLLHRLLNMFQSLGRAARGECDTHPDIQQYKRNIEERMQRSDRENLATDRHRIATDHRRAFQTLVQQYG